MRIYSLTANACPALRVVALLTATFFLKPPGSAAIAANLFVPAPGFLTALDPDGIYPQGRRFGFGLYSILGNIVVDPEISNMHRAAVHGFTLAGPYYDNSWWDFGNIYSAASQGMRFTFQIRPPESLFNVSVEDRPAALDALSDTELAAHVRSQVTAVFEDPIARDTVARWTLAPDELRYWHASEMRYLRVASETIRAVEADFGLAHRPFWMYEPRHRNASALELTGAYQDMTTKGVYLTGIPRGPERSAYAIWGYSQIDSAAKQLHTVPQAALQLSEDFSDPRTGTDPYEIRRVLRHDVYLGLVMGMKGFNVWSMYEHRPNLTTHAEQFEAYASVAQDLTGTLDLQRVFLFGQRRDDLDITITQGATQFQYTDYYGDTFTYDTLHYFNAAFGPHRYLFLVNSTEEVMDVQITGFPRGFLAEDLFAGTTSEVWQSQLDWRLPPLGVAALRFHRRSFSAPLSTAAAGRWIAPEPPAALLIILAQLIAPTLSRTIARGRRRALCIHRLRAT